ncbi:MAG: tryptophan-rich sensory protein [Gemmatimonadetes bacterium]|nr:tryptophan-rich sensory protein [Gemmatimonadota bacterium]
MSISRQITGWVLWTGASLAAGYIGNLLSGVTESQFYQQLQRPDWAPPPSVFGPVWITLYVMMGTAAWLVWRERGFAGARTPLTLFLVHLLFNAAWTGIFFGLEAPGLALAEIVLLWGMILALVVLFWRIRVLAGALMVPYLLWVTFATVLTYSIWRLNPEL